MLCLAHRQRPSATRRGVLLLEVMATLVVILIFIGLGAGLIRLLLRLDRSSRDGWEAATALTSVAHDFRLDAHRADPTAAPSPDGRTLTLRLPGREVVTYTVEPRLIRREHRAGDRLLGREQYRLAPHALARFERSPSGGRPLLALVIRTEAPAGARPTAAQPARIIAELGRWATPAATTNPPRTP